MWGSQKTTLVFDLVMLPFLKFCSTMIEFLRSRLPRRDWWSMAALTVMARRQVLVLVPHAPGCVMVTFLVQSH